MVYSQITLLFCIFFFALFLLLGFNLDYVLQAIQLTYNGRSFQVLGVQTSLIQII